MNSSRCGTITVPNIQSTNPVAIAAAPRGGRALRVAVRNVGGMPVRLSFEAASLGNLNANTVDHYQLPVDATETFVVAPGQTLYAIAVGLGGALTYTSNEAIQVVGPMI